MTRRTRVTGSRGLTGVIGLIGFVAAAAVVLLANIATAAAQTSSLDGPGTAYAPPVETSPFNSGGLVFFFVAAVLVVGAGLLYIRNRAPHESPPTPSEPTS